MPLKDSSLETVVKNCQIRLFADHSCLFITVDNREHTAKLINEDLCAIEKWAKGWLVNFSPAKTESMIFSSKSNITPHPRLIFQNTPIAQVFQHKHVGLLFQSSLWWHYHINDIYVKCQKRLNLLKHYKFRVSRLTLEKMYFAFVRPILEYGDVVWAGAHDCHLVKLDRLQLEAMRIVTGAPNKSNIANLYNDLNWELLSDRRDRHSLIIMFKMVKNLVPTYLCNLKPTQAGDSHEYNLRNNSDLSIPFCRTQCMKKSFLPCTVKLWNSLQNNIKLCDTLSSFKLKLKSHYAVSENFSKMKKFLYNSGSRPWNIVHAKLRIGCSSLNDHLFNNLHVIDSPASLQHFFFECPLYLQQRTNLFDALSGLPCDLDTLVYGNFSLSLDNNLKIFDQIHIFVEHTDRFAR